jgi:hypothetical protein
VGRWLAVGLFPLPHQEATPLILRTKPLYQGQWHRYPQSVPFVLRPVQVCRVEYDLVILPEPLNEGTGLLIVYHARDALQYLID